jgi:hypothetical protein
MSSEPCGILLGTDSNQEWLLPWCVGHIRRTGCELPIAFADFGMSDDAARWCKTQGRVFTVGVPRSVSTWCVKPMAIRMSPFHRTLWLDADCQCLSDPAQAMLAAGDGTFALTLDPRSPTCKWATGVVVAESNDRTLYAWSIESTTGRHRGDQEALHAILDRVERHITPLDQRYQRVRLEGDAQPGDVIYHWTGPVGKRAIRDMIAAEAVA